MLIHLHQHEIRLADGEQRVFFMNPVAVREQQKKGIGIWGVISK